MKKHYFYSKIVVSTIILLLITPNISFAATNAKTTATEKVAAAQEQRMNNLKQRADQEINRRVSALTTLITKINSIKRITDNQKTSFTAEINDSINSLNSLKTKITADTELEILKTDVKSIVDSYRIYLLFMPKINLLSAVNAAQDTASQLESLTTKIEQRIALADAAGKDTSSLKTALADLKSKIATAQTEITDIQNTLIPLTPEGYPDNKTVLTTARKSLKDTQQELITAKQNAKTIIQDIKALNNSQETTEQ